ncbi:MAG: hypothetical protein HY331_06060 [Chloroflexi bacterium]|nr:hypothetical protein [Chloroflexota bacterium]
MGLVDLGLAVAAYTELTQAARVGARAGIYPWADDASIRSAVQSRPVLWSAIPASAIAISPGVRTSGGLITVTVTYTYTPITPYVVQMVGGGIVEQSVAVDVVD